MTRRSIKQPAFVGRKKQQGNYLLSIGIGIMIMAILAVWAIPKIQDYLVEGAVPSVAEETQRFISRLKVNTAGTGALPFAGVTQAYFARSVRGSSLQVSDAGGVAGEGTTGTIVRHGLGGGSAGTIEIALLGSGAAFTLTFKAVGQAACPSLATALQRSVADIKINTTTNVKVSDPEDGTVTTGYVAGKAAAACTDGDTNTFVFTVR